MNLTDAYATKIPGRKYKFVRGRGQSSGVGKTCGRGHKGQKSRAGVSFRPYFEGGQMPNIRRLPKRGFNNKIFKTDYEVVNVSALEKAFEAGETVDEASLRAKKLVRRVCDGIKILGDGTLSKKLTVRVHALTKAAEEKITQAGGTAERIGKKEEAPSATEQK